MPAITIFLCGDVMAGRGVDQVLPHPSQPGLHESYVESAIEYVDLAERAHGPISKPVDFGYVWGDAAGELQRAKPAARIINLETSVTTSETFVLKGINYRMNPANIPCLTAAKIDCCSLANNHVLDWGYAGLNETLTALHAAGIQTAGAGQNLVEAARPAAIDAGHGTRILIFGCGLIDSGIPRDWAARGGQAGVALLADTFEREVTGIAQAVRAARQPGDLAVLSIHWGPNWGYPIPRDHRTFAHRLIDTAGIDLIHGHSSHHPKPIEVYNGKLILYGCGDFLNDYEGISGYEDFRSHLVLMYVATLDSSSGRLQRLEMTPLEIQRFRLKRASREDAGWLQATLTREGKQTGTKVTLTADGHFTLQWSGR